VFARELPRLFRTVPHYALSAWRDLCRCALQNVATAIAARDPLAYRALDDLLALPRVALLKQQAGVRNQRNRIALDQQIRAARAAIPRLSLGD
jgi:hypothetical protein